MRTAGRVVAAGFAVGWVAWSLVAAAMARAGGLDGGRVPLIGLTVAVPLLVLLAAARIPAVARALERPQVLAWLVQLQTFRVVGGVFLLVWALGELPARFAAPAGFGLLGLLDLVVAVAAGFLSAPGPYQLFAGAPDTSALTRLPLVLIPAAAVSLAAAAHLVALRAAGGLSPVVPRRSAAVAR